MLAARFFLAAWDYSLRLNRLGIASRGYARRISLSDPLHAYPGATNARVELPSCVTPLLPVRGWVGSPEGSPLANPIGLGADTVVLEYQPVVHRLRLSASP